MESNQRQVLHSFWIKQRHSLDAKIPGCYHRTVKLAGWSRPGNPGRGKSALHRAWCRLTAGRGNPTESATERHIAGWNFGSEPVRVKRWCKRPPAAAEMLLARQTPPGARSSRVDDMPGHYDLACSAGLLAPNDTRVDRVSDPAMVRQDR